LHNRRGTGLVRLNERPRHIQPAVMRPWDKSV
jgi:hypothetical protein